MAVVDRVSPTRLLLRVEEAAERLGIARTSMFRLIATQQVESVTVGRLRRMGMRRRWRAITYSVMGRGSAM